MKKILFILALGFIFPVLAQDTIPTPSKKMALFPKSYNPRLAELREAPKVLYVHTIGQFKIDKIVVQEKTKTNKKLIKDGLGTTINIAKNTISGLLIEPISYNFIESESLELADFLYRSFGKVPEILPSDLPNRMMVQKLSPSLNGPAVSYGIAKLPDGTILFPYNNTLLYLRPI